MDSSTKRRRPPRHSPANPRAPLPGQVVLVLQGGGALGAYQVGVFEALQEAGIAPDWVIGTSISAINGALIAGNPPERRLQRLREFWAHVEQQVDLRGPLAWLDPGNVWANWATLSGGIPSFFAPNPVALYGARARVGAEHASYYSTAPLRDTLSDLIDFDHLAGADTRLTVGTVQVETGQLRYFDSREERLGIDHVMASGALPPAFPATRIEGDAYWDGGIYSNTPIEAVLDDKPRRDSLIFAINVWQSHGREPESIWEVMGRQKEIQYASRADTQIERQRQLHRLRHVIRELQRQLPAARQQDAHVKELAAWGCSTTMHVVRLLAPRLEGEDHTKDIDFTASGVAARRLAGRRDAAEMIQRAPWQTPVDPIEGVIVHSLPER